MISDNWFLNLDFAEILIVFLFQDFSEHGIAPKTLKVKSDYKDYEPVAKKKLPSDMGFNFDDMIKPTRSTLGVRMLKKMGWREGQGIGPRIKRKLRNLKTKIAHGRLLLLSLNRL